MKPDFLQIVTIYILVMYMTQNYHKLLDEKKLEIVKVATIYIACFHEKMFLRSTAKAPTNDLIALQLTFQLIDQDMQVTKDMAAAACQCSKAILVFGTTPCLPCCS